MVNLLNLEWFEYHSSIKYCKVDLFFNRSIYKLLINVYRIFMYQRILTREAVVSVVMLAGHVAPESTSCARASARLCATLAKLLCNLVFGTWLPLPYVKFTLTTSSSSPW